METIVTIAILAIALALLVSVLSGFRSAGYLIDSDTHIINMLRDARARTLSSKGDTQYGVHFEAGRAVLFVGNTYHAAAGTNEIYSLPAGVSISTITLGGGSDVVFARLSGMPSASGTITIQLKQDPAQTKTVTILATGGIN